jgi:FkbM family methyltransferase
MTQPPVVESTFANLFRRTFRSYRKFPISPGHALLRRLFRALISRHQAIRLRNGIRLVVDLDSVVQHTLFWMDGDMEPQLEWAVREFLPAGGTCVDCGANCGYIGLFARRMRSAKVVFVEPHPVLAATVRRNVAANGWEARCTVVEAAASEAEGSAQLFECPEYDGAHSLLKDWAGDRPDARGPEVRLTTLAKVFEEQGLGRIDLLKVDTEGHDVSVLKGLGPELRPDRIRVLYTELGRNREEGIRLLESAGYAGFAYRPIRGKKLRQLIDGYRDDRPLMLFTPLAEATDAHAETLWLPAGGPEVAHMAALAKLAAAQ